MYRQRTEWTETFVRQSRTGYVIDHVSSVQGDTTKRKVLIPFSAEFPPGLDLNAQRNDDTTHGAAIIHAYRNGHPHRNLRVGHTVR